MGLDPVWRLSMIRKVKILCISLALSALCPLLLAADDPGPAGGPPPPQLVGYFQGHPIFAELICLLIFVFLVIIAMASNTTTETIQTKHSDFWGKPLGTSYTNVSVPKQPSSWRQIKNALLILWVIYSVLRYTCLAGVFDVTYKFIGACMDHFFNTGPGN
jgi:hypothetical protein